MSSITVDNEHSSYDQFIDEAHEYGKFAGRTPLYAFQDDFINEKFGGGLAKPGFSNIILIAGACIADDTLVRATINNKRKQYKIQCLYHRFHNIPYRHINSRFMNQKIERFQVRSVDEETGLFYWNDVQDIIDVGEKEAYEISDEKNKIIVSKDHIFLTDKGYVKLKNLKIGDKIAKHSSLKYKGGKKFIPKNRYISLKYHPRFYRDKKFISGGQEKIGRYYCAPEHILRYEAVLNDMSFDDYINLLNHYDGREIKFVPSFNDIHHINHNHFDNRPENLQMISHQEHGRIHKEQSALNFKNKMVFSKVKSIKYLGKKHMYDICCSDPYHNYVANDFVSHNSGVGKTLLTLNIITSAIKENKKICHLLLEDDPGAAVYNLIQMNGEEVIKNYKDKNYFLGPDKMKDQYTKDDALIFIESALKAGFDLVVIDHIQFMFEATATQKDEWMQQRVFIRQLNRIVKQYKKTVVIVSHVNKTAMQNNYSLDSTTGSNSIGQVATKALMIYRDENKILRLKQEKSRYTKPYFEQIPIKFDKNLIVRYDREIDDGKLEELL